MRGVLGNVFFVVLLGRPRSSYVNNGIEATSGFGIHCVRLSLSALCITKPNFLQCKTHFFCFSFTVFSCFLCPSSQCMVLLGKWHKALFTNHHQPLFCSRQMAPRSMIGIYQKPLSHCFLPVRVLRADQAD